MLSYLPNITKLVLTTIKDHSFLQDKEWYVRTYTPETQKYLEIFKITWNNPFLYLILNYILAHHRSDLGCNVPVKKLTSRTEVFLTGSTFTATGIDPGCRLEPVVEAETF